jgi:hypothetical protein
VAGIVVERSGAGPENRVEARGGAAAGIDAEGGASAEAGTGLGIMCWSVPVRCGCKGVEGTEE